MNISPETIATLLETYSVHLSDQNGNYGVPVEAATELVIGRELSTDKLILKTIKATKKEMTVAYVMAKLTADKVYKNFAPKFEKLLSISNMNIYPTSYGIGVFVAMGFRAKIEAIKTEVEAKLNELGIEYKTEYSDAGYVFRYKISKSAANISKLENI